MLCVDVASVDGACIEQALAVPWRDIPTSDTELVQASRWAYSLGIFQGYGDGTFGVHQPMLRRQVALVAGRANLTPAPWLTGYAAASRSDVAAGIPGLTWLETRWNESVTRSQVLRLMYRARYGLGPEAGTAQRLEEWVAETQDSWGLPGEPRLAGYAGLFVQLSRQYNVPVWLALGQCWYESGWGSTGLSIAHNCLFGVKDTTGKWGRIKGTVNGFADYVNLEECIKAYYRLMNGVYRGYIDAKDWQGLIEKYAPSSENSVNAYVTTLMVVCFECEYRDIK